MVLSTEPKVRKLCITQGLGFKGLRTFLLIKQGNNPGYTITIVCKEMGIDIFILRNMRTHFKVDT